jgi:hypothetical protein
VNFGFVVRKTYKFAFFSPLLSCGSALTNLTAQCAQCQPLFEISVLYR